MRLLLLVTTAACLAATTAGAADVPTMDAAKLAWKQPPSVRDLARHFPRKAQVERVGRGSAKVHCTARADGRLACEAAEQSPADYGFGDAAVKVVQAARVRATDGGSLEGRQFSFGLKFGDWSKAVQARLQPLAAPGLAWETPPAIAYADVSRLPKGRHVATLACLTGEDGSLTCEADESTSASPYTALVLQGLSSARVKSVDDAPVSGRRFSQTQAMTVK